MSTSISIQKETPGLVLHAETLVVSDNKTVAEATELLSRLNKISDLTEAEKNKVMRPALDVVAAERKRWKPIETQINAGIEALRSKLSRYQTEQTRLARIESDKIASRVAPGKGNLSIETASKKLAAIDKPEESITTYSGSLTFRPKKVLKITDENKIPRHYLIVNESLLLEDLKKGISVFGAELEIIQVPVNHI